MLPRRQERINQLVKQAISDIVESGLKRTAPGLITITNVKVSPDLSVAWIDFTVIGADDAIAQKFLQSSAYYIVSQMATKIRLRSLPKLKFEPDKVAKRAGRIEELLREINREADTNS
jgi:ribosome-binding factor A